MYFAYAVPLLKKAMELSRQGKTQAYIMSALKHACL